MKINVDKSVDVRPCTGRGGGARTHAQQSYLTPLPSHSEEEGQVGVVKVNAYTLYHMLQYTPCVE